MTATAPPPGTMARRAIPQTAVPAMTAPGQPTALCGPDALPRTLRPSLPACRAMPPGVLRDIPGAARGPCPRCRERARAWARQDAPFQRDDWGKVAWFAVTVRLPLSR